MSAVPFSAMEVGRTLEPLVKPPIEKVQLVMYAGASGDFNMIHTDDETAKSVGLPGAIAHGMLSMGFLGQYAAQLVGTSGYVSRLKVRFSGMVRPGDVLTCKATVASVDDVLHSVNLTLWAEREVGKPLTMGEATLQYLAPRI